MGMAMSRCKSRSPALLMACEGAVRVVADCLFATYAAVLCSFGASDGRPHSVNVNVEATIGAQTTTEQIVSTVV